MRDRRGSTQTKLQGMRKTNPLRVHRTTQLSATEILNQKVSSIHLPELCDY